MTLFQLVLLAVAGTIFYLFFRQLFGGDYPRRGVDYESQLSGERPGGLAQPGRTAVQPTDTHARLDTLMEMADRAAERRDWLEVKKAMQSALILDEACIQAHRRIGIALLEMNDFGAARQHLERVLEADAQDDLIHSALANALHKLGEDDAAITHHEQAIALDGAYAPHHYNYANTLYDLGRRQEALALYRQAYALDPELKEAHAMIRELQS